MKKLLTGSLLVNFVILISGCSSDPPKPVLPDGSHRVPVNRELPVPPVPSAASTVGAAS
ncbi:MAG: hypothetical protein AB1704_15440 [Pseudomonadota bacterium]|jgi:hypothetical protein|uniref:hypothetical protein n=1 Tax=Burkholderiaceae TaxID=119060 RepID=UPI0014853736|nr:hypothetical protein [Burkholderia sp. 4M9327F10]